MCALLLCVGREVKAQADSAMTKELYYLKNKFTSWLLIKASKLTPEIRVIRNYNSEPEFGIVWEKNYVSGGQEISEYYSQSNEEIYFAQWGKINGVFKTSTLSYDAPYKTFQFATNCNGSEAIFWLRNGNSHSSTEFRFDKGGVIASIDQNGRDSIYPKDYLTNVAFLKLRDSLTTFLAKNNPKPRLKDSGDVDAKLVSYLKALEIEKAPSILGTFNFFNLSDNTDCWKNGWEELLHACLRVLVGTKEPARVLFTDLACAYTLDEQIKFNKACISKVATEAGRKAIYDWIIPVVKPIVALSAEIASTVSSILNYLLDFDYQYEKAYYQKCVKENREGDFVRVNPKTGDLDWNRWLISWVYRRVNDGTFTQETVHSYTKKAIKDLNLTAKI
jgi:hypothetical protein